MNMQFLVTIAKIKNLISEHFPNTMLSITSDNIYGDIIVSISNREDYYSLKFQELISYININILWPSNITNFIFVADEQIEYDSIFSNVQLNNSYSVKTNWIIPETEKYSVNLQYNNCCDDDCYLKVA